MEIIQKKSGTNNGKRLLRCFVFLFIFFLFTLHQAIAQATDSAAQTTTASTDDGFAKKENTAKVFDEARKIQEKNHQDEIIQWVIMIGGFSIVIGIAWFTTSLAKKRKMKEDEMRAKRAQTMQNHNPHRKVPRR